LPPEVKIVVRGYENGYNEIIGLKKRKITISREETGGTENSLTVRRTMPYLLLNYLETTTLQKSKAITVLFLPAE
jgi:hypothetical protein